MIISSPLRLFTQRETHMPLLQTSLHIRSASAAWENTNHSAAAAMPIRILLIVSPPDCSCGQSCFGGLVPEGWRWPSTGGEKPNEIIVRNSISAAALNWGSIESVQGFDWHPRRITGAAWDLS